MRKVRLAPRFKLWLILGTTVGLIITALLALMLASGPRPAVEIESAATAFSHTSASDFGAALVPWPALPESLAVPSRELGASFNGNQPVLALCGATALALAFGALWAARQRRNAGASEQVSPGLSTPAKVSPAASV